MSVNLERLKRSLHPETPMNIVEQCRIVYEALAVGGAYQGQRKALAEYLEISPNKVYKMQRAHNDAIPDLKEWFKRSDYKMNTYYDKATLPPGAQRVFIRDADTLSQTIMEEKG